MNGPRFHLVLTSLTLLTLMLLPACEEAAAPPAEGTGEGGAEWVSGTVDERFQQVGDQLAGFSATMFEVAHRYRELHWAVEDENWDYATYQTEKIAEATELGIIRRPGRAESARSLFLGPPVHEMLAALESGEADVVERAFQEFTAACNQCHVAEEMEFVVVGAPASRSTIVQP
jgi:hypothetical protein